MATNQRPWKMLASEPPPGSAEIQVRGEGLQLGFLGRALQGSTTLVLFAVARSAFILQYPPETRVVAVRPPECFGPCPPQARGAVEARGGALPVDKVGLPVAGQRAHREEAPKFGPVNSKGQKLQKPLFL